MKFKPEALLGPLLALLALSLALLIAPRHARAAEAAALCSPSKTCAT